MTPTQHSVPQNTELYEMELGILRSLFDCALETDDWDRAKRAFYTLLQASWELHDMQRGVPLTACPVVEPEPVGIRPGMYFCEVD